MHFSVPHRAFPRVLPSCSAVCRFAVAILLVVAGFFGDGAHAQDLALGWANPAGDTGFDVGYGITSDAAGNVYSVGHFEGVVDFDPGVGTVNLTSQGTRDFFVQKMDADGNLLWARACGGTNNDAAFGVAVDTSGNVYVTGSFRNTVDFDPGAGVFNVTSAGSDEVYLLKLDASGNFVSVSILPGPAGNIAYAIAIDAGGNILLTGTFNNSIDCDPGAGVFTLTDASGGDVFIVKLDSSGNLVWAGALISGSSMSARSIAVDASGNVYSMGEFSNTTDFNPGAGVANISSLGASDVYLSALDTNGNFLWAGSLAGTQSLFAQDITADTAGNLYAVGFYSGTADLDPGAGTLNRTSAGAADGYILKLAAATGNLTWAQTLETDDFTTVEGIAVDAGGTIYVSGAYNGTTDLDPGVGAMAHTSLGVGDGYVLTLNNSGAFVGVSTFVGTNDIHCTKLALGAPGSLYVVGHFRDTVDFDPEFGLSDLTSAGGADIFTMRLDPATPGPVGSLPVSGLYTLVVLSVMLMAGAGITLIRRRDEQS